MNFCRDQENGIAKQVVVGDAVKKVTFGEIARTKQVPGPLLQTTTSRGTSNATAVVPSTGCVRAYKHKTTRGKNKQSRKPTDQDENRWVQPKQRRAPQMVIPKTDVELRN